jgi:hypothetical protein
MKRLYSIFALLLIFADLVSAQVTLKIQAPSQTEVGRRIRVSFVANTQDVEDIQVGEFPGFKVIYGPSTSSSIEEQTYDSTKFTISVDKHFKGSKVVFQPLYVIPYSMFIRQICIQAKLERTEYTKSNITQCVILKALYPLVLQFIYYMQFRLSLHIPLSIGIHKNMLRTHGYFTFNATC